jgi:hypothetical protein
MLVAPRTLLSNLKIHSKLSLSRSFSVAACILITLAGAFGLQQLHKQTDYLYESQVHPLSYLQEVHASELKSRLDLHRITVSTTAQARQDRLDGLRQTDAELATATAGYERTS